MVAATVGERACAQELGALSSLAEKDLVWVNLPRALKDKVIPITADEDLKYKTGLAENGQEFLRIRTKKGQDLAFGVKPFRGGMNGYLASAKEAFYWPSSELFRLEKEVVISASACRLEGDSFDVHVGHETTRLAGAAMVITLPNGLVPIESGSVRISGLGDSPTPRFEWDPIPIPRSTPLPKPAPRAAKRYDIDLVDGGTIAFQGEEVEIESLEMKIRDLAAKEPDSTFQIAIEPSVDVKLARRVNRLIEESGFDQADTIRKIPEMAEQNLEKEVDGTVFVEPKTEAPKSAGGNLLWVEGAGQYVLNGTAYDDGTLRQVLRKLARLLPNRPIVIAAKKGAPEKYLHGLVEDLRAFGFKEVMLARPAPKTSRKP